MSTKLTKTSRVDAFESQLDSATPRHTPPVTVFPFAGDGPSDRLSPWAASSKALTSSSRFPAALVDPLAPAFDAAALDALPPPFASSVLAPALEGGGEGGGEGGTPPPSELGRRLLIAFTALSTLFAVRNSSKSTARKRLTIKKPPAVTVGVAAASVVLRTAMLKPLIVLKVAVHRYVDASQGGFEDSKNGERRRH